MEPEKLEIKAAILDKDGFDREPIKIIVTPFKKSVGYGSYNIIESDIINLQNSYRITEIYFASTKEVKLVGDDHRQVLLKPNEAKKIFWQVSVDSNLNDDFIYTFPVIVSSLRNISGATEFVSGYNQPKYGFTEISNIINDLTEEEAKIYSRSINLQCDADKDKGYRNEIANIDCSLENLGNVFLKDLKICVNENCQKVDLGISIKENLEFVERFDTVGSKDIKVTASNEYISKSYYLTLLTFR